jgi:hypothetical protein
MKVLLTIFLMGCGVLLVVGLFFGWGVFIDIAHTTAAPTKVHQPATAKAHQPRPAAVRQPDAGASSAQGGPWPWRFTDASGVKFVNCVDHMIANRPIFHVYYSENDNQDHLDLGASRWDVKTACDDLWYRAKNVCFDETPATPSGSAEWTTITHNVQCEEDSFALIDAHLLKAWNNGKRDGGGQ